MNTSLLAASVASTSPTTLLISIFGVLIIWYLVYGTTLSIIADKAGIKHGWLAWIPIANFFLMLSIAGLSFWYFFALAFVVAILHIAKLAALGALIAMFVTMYIWIRICERLGKSPLLGVLGGIPLFNIFLQIYLAVSPAVTAVQTNGGKESEALKTMRALPVDLGVFNFIKTSVAAGKSKDEIYSTLQSQQIAQEQFDAAYSKAVAEVGK